MVLCTIPPYFRSIAGVLKKLERKHRPSDLIQAYYTKIQCSLEHAKIALACMGISYDGTVHHLIKFQAES